VTQGDQACATIAIFIGGDVVAVELGDPARAFGVFRDAARSDPDLGAVADHLDAALALRGMSEEFVTAVLVTLSNDGGRAVMVNCGHPPPMLLHAGVVTEVESIRTGSNPTWVRVRKPRGTSNRSAGGCPEGATAERSVCRRLLIADRYCREAAALCPRSGCVMMLRIPYACNYTESVYVCSYGLRRRRGMEKPERILDRDTQWAALTRFLGRGGPRLRLGLLSGRRRQGKSYLLRALTDACGGLYVTAVQEEGARASQERFRNAIARHAGLPVGSLALEDWEQILAAALEITARRAQQTGSPPLLVIDEFPYLLAHSPQLPSLLQHLYDDSQQDRAPGGRLILCGSAMSVMHELLSGTKPLRGRAVLDMCLGPFDHRQTAELWGIDDPELAFRLHAVLGGAPGYRQLVQDDPPQDTGGFGAWVVDNLFDVDLGLFTRNETEFLLREDPRITNRVVYYEVLAAAAAGASTPTKIGGLIGRERTSLAHILDVLLSSGYLRREDDLLRQRKPTLSVADPVIRFNQLITVPSTELLERGLGQQVWDGASATFHSQILGPHFEELARDWVRHYAQTEIGIDPGAVGTTDIHDVAGRAKHELDVVALAPGEKPRTKSVRIALLGEAKATGRRRGTSDLDRLDHLRTVLAGEGHDAAHAHLAVFSEHGFTRDLNSTAARRPDVHLVALAQLYGRN
jgi:AAA+ ATPase superfamily predicted ATPase